MNWNFLIEPSAVLSTNVGRNGRARKRLALQDMTCDSTTLASGNSSGRPPITASCSAVGTIQYLRGSKSSRVDVSVRRPRGAQSHPSFMTLACPKIRSPSIRSMEGNARRRVMNRSTADTQGRAEARVSVFLPISTDVSNITEEQTPARPPIRARSHHIGCSRPKADFGLSAIPDNPAPPSLARSGSRGLGRVRVGTPPTPGS